MRKVAIIQARMGSTRLPGKVLMDLAGEPMLARVVERARRARHLDEVVVATTDRSADDVVEALCSERGWKCFRGSETDVLDRYCRAAQAYNAGLIVRITSDCPLTDPLLFDDTIECLVRNEAEYSSNVFPRTYPRGLDVEAFAAPALERAWREARAPHQREHVTPYIYEHPELFRMASISGHRDYSSHRWTVDTPEDLEFARLVFQHFKHDRFSWEEVLPVLEQHPDWIEINRHVMQKTV